MSHRTSGRKAHVAAAAAAGLTQQQQQMSEAMELGEVGQQEEVEQYNPTTTQPHTNRPSSHPSSSPPASVSLPVVGATTGTKRKRGSGATTVAGSSSGSAATTNSTTQQPAKRGRKKKVEQIPIEEEAHAGESGESDHEMMEEESHHHHAGSMLDAENGLEMGMGMNMGLNMSLANVNGGNVDMLDGDMDGDDDDPTPAKKRKGNNNARDKGGEGRDSKGLRHFSILVCEKLQSLGTSTYKEIADQLVLEAMKREEKRGKEEGMNNIRRRIYDALNVLMAMDIITKERKNIRWKGFEGALGLPAGSISSLPSQQSPSGGDSSTSTATMAGGGSKKSNQATMSKSVQNLQASIESKKASLPEKRAQLEELVLQYCGLRALLQRNAKAAAASPTPTIRPSSNIFSSPGPAVSPIAPSPTPSTNGDEEHKASEEGDEKIQWPFLVLAAPPGIPVECTTDEPRQMAILNFAEPFVVHEHTRILQYYGAHFIRQTPLPSLDQAIQQVVAASAPSPAHSNDSSIHTATAAAATATVPAPAAATKPTANDALAVLDSLAAVAAASPKIKLSGARSKLTNSSSSSSASASSSFPTAHDQSDPRVGISSRIWSLLPPESVLQPSGSLFATAHLQATSLAHSSQPLITPLPQHFSHSHQPYAIVGSTNPSNYYANGAIASFAPPAGSPFLVSAIVEPTANLTATAAPSSSLIKKEEDFTGPIIHTPIPMQSLNVVEAAPIGTTTVKSESSQ